MPKLQRLLYISSESTHPQSPALSAAIYEPIKEARTEVDPTSEGVPYSSVHEAMMDGWRVIQVPDLGAGIGSEDAGEVIGFQFVLEKIEDFLPLHPAQTKSQERINR